MTRSRAGAFTLVELLIVITIIGLLIGIALFVGSRVADSGKKSATESTLKILDSALSAYVADKGVPPPAVVDDPRNPIAGQRYVIPVADARNMVPTAAGAQTMINSVGLFLLQCKGIAGAEEAIRGIDARYVRELAPDGEVASNPSPETQPRLRTVFDAWGNPIRYVHPAFKGAVSAREYGSGTPSERVDLSLVIGRAKAGSAYGITFIRRSIQPGITDADLGIPQGDRPYFYSAGPDGNPATTADNVYLFTPTFAKQP